MILSTTPTLQGMNIVAYKGLVFGEVIEGVDIIKDFTAGLRNIVGGRSADYEDELIEARNHAIRELIVNAEKLGANAVVGIDFDYEVLGSGNNMLMVSVSGTAVVAE